MKKIFAIAFAGFAALPLLAGTANVLGNAPLFFEANSASQFSARGADCAFSISPAESKILLQKNSSETAAVQMQFPGANSFAQIRGENELAGKINYLIGERSQWRLGAPTFGKVRVAGIYPGIDLIYHGNQKQLEYDFEIASGANPNAIQIHFNGAEKISINAQGELILKVNGGEIIQPTPEIFQIVGNRKILIHGGYKILDTQTVSFALGNYNHSLSLTIDPTIAFSTYFGGTAADTAWSVARGADGSIYVGGQTFSKRFYQRGPKYNPFSTDGALQETFAGGNLTGDGFVAKFDSTGSNLVYLTYLGGNKDEYVSSIAVDSAGNAYVTGFTDSTNFPVVNALYSNVTGTFNRVLHVFPSDAFVSELDSSGSNLVFSTRLGGSSWDVGSAIAIDASDNIYVAGYTDSTNFPTVNPLQINLMGTNNAFIAEIAPGGSALLFSSYLGGENIDAAEGVAVDTNGYIYIAGYSDSPNFPVTTNHILFTNQLFGVTNQIVGTNVVDGSLLNGTASPTNLLYDAFVTKLQPGGAGFVYSTLLGGGNDDRGYGVACDGDGNAYVVGYSASTNFPNTAVTNFVAGLHSFNATNHNFSIRNKDVFLTKLGPEGTNIIYSALFGGKYDDVGYGVAVDSNGDAFVTGSTQSADFPTNSVLTIGLTNLINHVSGRLTGKGYLPDIFVTAFNPDCSAMIYSTYIGGTGNDYGYGIAVDPVTGNAFVTGATASKKFPILNAGQDFLNGRSDTFLLEIQP